MFMDLRAAEDGVREPSEHPVGNTVSQLVDI
jgi:hypothetical protein